MNVLAALVANPSAAVLSSVAALSYAVLAWAHRRMSAMQVRMVIGAAWLLHLLSLAHGLLGDPVRFGFAPALSITAWLLLTVYLVESRLYPQLQARWPLAALGAMTVVLALLFPGSHYPALRSPWLPLHWALGIASYGLIGAAVVHAWLMQRAERAMRLGGANDASMPLLMLERLTFRFVGAGFALLSATLVAGVLFAEAFRHAWVWDHKTVFSVLSWFVMGILLLGRWRMGWRGRMAARMVYLGAGFLLLGYVGSRFVIEVILHRL